MKKVLLKSKNQKIELVTNSVESPEKIIVCMHGFTGDLWGDGYSHLRHAFKNTLVCSYDSAGHGESKIQSIDMRLDKIAEELFIVINYLSEKYKNIPIVIYALSYGAYRTIVSISRYELKNIKHIVLVNPAFKMLDILEKLKEFKYSSLKEDDIVPMKKSLNKYLSKKFLDDIYENNVYEMNYQKIPTTIFIGTLDGLIPRKDTLDFAKIHGCDVVYIEDDHCIGRTESWEKLIKFLEKI